MSPNVSQSKQRSPRHSPRSSNGASEIVKTIQVPVYNAPGNLSAKTYQTLQKYQEQKIQKGIAF